jgi:AhpD family alkylhydroperoxidase
MVEHRHGRQVLQPLTGEGRALRQHIPEVYSAFSELSTAAMAPGALDSITKELIALALAVSLKCDGCIAAHARGAAAVGATRQQVAEALGVTILLDGGPGTVYGPRAFDAFCDFVAEREQRAASGVTS